MGHGGYNGTNMPSCKTAKEHLVQIEAPVATHWKTLDELHQGPPKTGEFPGGLPGSRGNAAEATRRDFLALMGFSLAAAGLAGCRAPVQHAIPMLVGTDDIVP